MLTLLYAVFILSGAAGLIYESIWARYLGLFVGHSAYAQVIVLVIFMGGMSLGALLAGERSARLRSPLLWYAAVELAAGLIGLVFHGAFGSITALAYDTFFPALGPGIAHTMVKWTIAALLILPQSVLLGTTFPLMSAGVIRLAPERAGRSLAILYFTNSFGAAAGVLVAGFVLVAMAGLPGTVVTAAILNILVALVVFVAVRTRWRPELETEVRVPGAAPVAVAGDGRLARALLLVAFGTAVASFIYEIAWVRMLSLVLGSATHSFELMLSAFILGLALGAWWIRTRVDAGSVRLLGIVQLAMGALAIATLPVYLMSFEWMAGAMAMFARTPEGYGAMSVFRYALCLAVMLPATFCAGMTLPLITRLLLSAGAGERAIGRVYGVNTLGSILGVTAASLLLMPVLGLKWLLVLGGSVDIALGVLLLAMERRANVSHASRRQWIALGVGAAGLFMILAGVRLDTTTLTSGVFRYGRVQRPGSADVLYYKDGRTATVSVRRIGATGGLSLATNGKPDASLGRDWLEPARPGAAPMPFTFDASTQALLAIIPLAFTPEAKQAAVIGQGSGMTSHVLLGSPVLERAVTIEIEPEMLRASRLFYPANQRVFDDPRSVFAIEDARSWFAAAAQTFDLVIAEPSNPWVAGVSGLFTAEFYAMLARYVAADGILGQWLHFREIDDGLVLSVVSALERSFPSYAMFAISDHDLLIVASKRERLPAPDWSITRRFAGIAKDLERFVPLTAHTFETLRLADQASLTPLARRSAPNSDFYPILDLNAERARYLQRTAEGFALLAGDAFSVSLALGGARNGFGAETTAVVAGVPRLAASTSAAALRHSRSGAAVPFAGFRNQVLRESLAGGAPRDWRGWVQAMWSAARELQGGTAGVGDTSLFVAMERFLNRTAPPVEARAAVDFMRGLSEWDFARAARGADVLLPAAVNGDLWLEADYLRDGAVTAYVRQGKIEKARATFVALAPRSTRAPDDIRSLVLESLLVPGAEVVNAGRPR